MKFQRERERERVKREITLESLINRDILEAIIIWFKYGNTELNLTKRWGERKWKFYQKNSKEFLKEGSDEEINKQSVKNDLLDIEIFERRIGFQTNNVGGYYHIDAKLGVVYDEEDIKKENIKRKIQFKVDTNDLGDEKNNRYANYLLAKEISEAWEKAGLPIYEKFGNLSEEEKKEILEIKKDPKKLKEFWLSQRSHFKEESLEKRREQEEEEKKRFGIE